MEALTDNPVELPEEDQYGFRPYAGILAGMVRDTPNLPFCMGIFGRWGTGKSSLMKLIECQLSGAGVVRCIWFNPWKYHRQEELWSALIRAVLARINEDGSEQAKTLATNLMKTAAWSVIKRAAGPLTMGIVSGEDLEKLKDSFAKTEERYQQHINAFEDDFAELVKLYTNDGKLVLFIDDLDRCRPRPMCVRAGHGQDSRRNGHPENVRGSSQDFRTRLSGQDRAGSVPHSARSLRSTSGVTCHGEDSALPGTYLAGA
jgi:hypothetical protein